MADEEKEKGDGLGFHHESKLPERIDNAEQALIAKINSVQSAIANPELVAKATSEEIGQILEDMKQIRTSLNSNEIDHSDTNTKLDAIMAKIDGIISGKKDEPIIRAEESVEPTGKRIEIADHAPEALDVFPPAEVPIASEIGEVPTLDQLEKVLAGYESKMAAMYETRKAELTRQMTALDNDYRTTLEQFTANKQQLLDSMKKFDQPVAA